MVLCAAPSYLEQNGAPEKPHELVAHNCLIHTRNNGRWRFAVARRMPKVVASFTKCC